MSLPALAAALLLQAGQPNVPVLRQTETLDAADRPVPLDGGAEQSGNVLPGSPAPPPAQEGQQSPTRAQTINEQRNSPELSDPLADPATAPVSQRVAVGPHRTPGDPYERFNRYWFNRQQSFDRALLRPAALGYQRAVPRPARSALRNFFRNLGEPLVFVNYLLQLKPGKAAETAGRFLINSTLGFGGLADIARQPKLNLPHRANGLGNTLGYYGVKPGPYLFLPLIGPTTLRDLIGGQAEGLALPLAVGKPFNRIEYQIPRAVIGGLDQRAEAEADLQALYGGAVDPYATLRSVYLQDRAGEIAELHGRPKVKAPSGELEDPLADPAGATPPATPAPPEGPDAPPPADSPAASPGTDAAPTVPPAAPSTPAPQ